MSLASVVIPVFNGASFLGDAIRSVAAQTHKDIELIVVDDGSSDNSFEVASNEIRDLALNGRVYVRPQTVRAGAGGCRNFGVSVASGDYIAFVDADDFWMPGHIKRAIDTFSDVGPSMGVYSAMCQKIGQDGRDLGPMPENGFPAAGLQDALPFLLLGMFLPTVTLCVRRAEYHKTLGFSETLSCYEDWWLVLQLAAKTRFFFDTEIGCKIRVGGGSLTRTPVKDGVRPKMSDAMYCDQLKLVDDAKRAGFLDASQLHVLREGVIEWNARQVNDVVSGGQVGETVRILRAIGRSRIADLVAPIWARAFFGVGKRAAAKLRRMSTMRDR
jgi:glycosyltransferase involved in cell wall biosynthesis